MRQVFNTPPYILPMEDERVISLCHQFGTLRFVKKGNILKDGGEQNRLFLLKSGLCLYMVNYMLEKPRVLGLLLPNRTMGDITCISGEIVNVTTVAIRDSEVLVVPPETLLDAMKRDFDLSKSITKKIIQKQECHIEGMLANFTLERAERLKVFYKVLLLEYNAFSNESWLKLPIKLSNEELGKIIHATRVTVNRIHLKWTEENVYKKENGNRYLAHSLFTNIYDWTDYKKIFFGHGGK